MEMDSKAGTFVTVKCLPFKKVFFPNDIFFNTRQSTLSTDPRSTDQIEEVAG